MPSRDPSYYRWSQDKPATTNQTYGYELRNTFGAGATATGSGQQNGASCSNNSGCHGSATCCNSSYDDSDYRFAHHSCVQCPDCVELSTRCSRKQKDCGGEPTLCPRHRRRVKTVLPSVNRFSPETAVKPINEGYVTGRVPVTKKLASGGGKASGVRIQDGGATSQGDNQDTAGHGKDLYLWHALSGSLVHCKNYEPAPERV